MLILLGILFPYCCVYLSVPITVYSATSVNFTSPSISISLNGTNATITITNPNNLTIDSYGLSTDGSTSAEILTGMEGTMQLVDLSQNSNFNSGASYPTIYAYLIYNTSITKYSLSSVQYPPIPPQLTPPTVSISLGTDGVTATITLTNPDNVALLGSGITTNNSEQLTIYAEVTYNNTTADIDLSTYSFLSTGGTVFAYLVIAGQGQNSTYIFSSESITYSPGGDSGGDTPPTVSISLDGSTVTITIINPSSITIESYGLSSNGSSTTEQLYNTSYDLTSSMYFSNGGDIYAYLTYNNITIFSGNYVTYTPSGGGG
jgi:hypothetical protein